MSAPEQHRSYAPKSLGFAAITVSDSRVDDDDRSGQVMRELIVGAQHTLIQHTIVPDEVEEIRDTLAALLDTQEVDVVVLSGGTGLAPRDVTVAAIDPIFIRVSIRTGIFLSSDVSQIYIFASFFVSPPDFNFGSMTRHSNLPAGTAIFSRRRTFTSRG